MELTHTDKQTGLWEKLRTHLQERLALLRAQNDNDADASATDKQRGRIAEIKLLLALENERPEVVTKKLVAGVQY
jgi:hypothetical protein